MRHLTWPVASAAALLALAFAAPRAEAACTFSPSPFGEPSLQTLLNGTLNPAPDTQSACLPDGDDAYWVSTAPTSATILLEIAGFANENRFGLYDQDDPGRRIQIFNGQHNPGTTAAIVFTSEALGTRITVTIGSTSWSSSALFTGEAFGFYLRTPQNNVFFSDSTLNSGGSDQMYAYRGNGGTFIGGVVATDGNPANDIFTSHDAILAYEDLLNGDDDFQDFVVLVRGVTPVPLPAAVWLLGPALLAAGMRYRRRRQDT